VFVCTISPDDMREIYDVIIACESMAAELLAGLPEFERGTKANALEALNASMGVALQNDDLLAWAKADDEFHRLLVVSCANRRIARIAETIMDQSHRARMLTLKLRLEMGPLGNMGYTQQTDRLSAECESKRLPPPASSSGRPSSGLKPRTVSQAACFFFV